MNKKLLLSLVPLLLLGIFLGIPSVVPPAHAAGTVCFNDPASFSISAPCSPAGTALNGPAPSATLTNPIPAGAVRGPNQIRIGIYLSGPDLINGFDITVLADRTVLRPTGVDLFGTILATPTSIVVECLDGALVTGPTCLSTDVPGTIHFSVSGGPGVLSTASTGLLFTAIYNITARSTATVPVRFQTGCGSPTSPTSDPPICVTMTNGGSGPVSESVGTIGFNNSVDPNWVAISTTTPSVAFNFGSASPLAMISATAEGGWPGIVGTDTISFTSLQPTGLTVSFTGAVTSCATGAPTTTTCGISASFNGSPGSYSVTFLGNYVYSNDTTLSPDGTLAGTVTVVVNIGDVSWTVNSLSEYPTTTAQNTYMSTKAPGAFLFTVQSLGGYTGTITYSTRAVVAGGTGFIVPTAGYPAPFTLGAGQTITKIINGTATANGKATYIPQILVTGFATAHASGSISVFVSGFTLSSNSTSVTFAPGGSGHVQLTSSSLGNPPSPNGFAGSVALTAPFTGPAGGVLTFTYAPASSITLTAGGTGSVTVAISGTTAGTYSVTFTGTGGTNNDMTNSTVPISVTVQGGGPPPGINISASPTSVTTNVGPTGATSTVTVASRGGFTGTVSLAATATGHASCSLTTTSITLGTSGTSTLSCNSNTAETDTATVTATSGTTTNSTSVTFHFTDFSTTASPTSVTTTAGTAATSTITVSPLNGFSGTVTLAVTTNSTNLSCTLSSSSVSGGSGTSTLSCTGSPAGNYLATVTGTSGSLSHSATVTYHVTAAADFGVTANPTSVSVNTGISGTSAITVTPVNGFTSTVTLAVTTNSTNLACTLSSTSITGGSGTSTLSCSASITGNYLATVTGTSGSLSHSATVTYHITPAPDFTVSVSPTSSTVSAGATGTSTITVAPLNGFTGTVTLAVTTNSTNLVCALSSTSIAAGSGTSMLSCHGSPAGNYLATVTGTSGSLSHSATVIYHIQDFSVTANPTTVSVATGTAGTSTISVAPLNGFTSTVALGVTTNSTSLVCTLSSSSISGGSGSSTLSCTANISGNYLATITGTSGTLSHSATVTYHVTAAADFSVTANPTSVTANAGATGTSAITVAPLNGFTATVTLVVTTNSTNLVCTLAATSITGGSGTSTLSCHGSPAGNYLATVTGTSGTLSHSATVTYHVQDFTVTASSTSVSVNVSAAGTSTITVAPVNGFTGTVTLAVTTNSTNLSCTLTSTSITGGSGTSTLSCTGSPAGNYLATVTGTSGALSHSATVVYHVTNAPDFTINASPTSVTVNASVAGTSTITVAPLNGFTGTVTLAVTTNSTNLSCTLSSTSITGGSGASTLSCTGSVAGNYLATVTGTSSSLSHTAAVTFHVTAAADFSVSANPTSFTVAVGVTGTSTISVAPLNGFTSTVALGVTTNSTSLVCTLSSSSISGGSGSSTLSCTANISGNYLATITGTSGTLSHSATVTYQVTAAVDFAIAANPTTVTVAVGSAGTSAITISPVNGFSGTVSLAVTTNSTNLSCTLSSTSISGGSGSSTLSCASSAAGNYLATVTGTSGTLSHSATVTYHITALPDFTIAASPTSVTAAQGVAATSTITVSPVNGFTGTVALAVTTSSTGLTCTLSTTSISGGSGTSTLSCTASTTGTFTATVTGTSGTLSHSAAVTFNVGPPPGFLMTASPTSVSVNVGVLGKSTISVAAQNGFTGTVTLSATTNSTNLLCTLSATSISGGFGSSTLSCTASAAGNYLATVTGTSGSLTNTVAVTYHATAVSAGDFTITASPTSVSFAAGSTGTTTITVTSVNGFTGTVTLTTAVSPSGLTATCSPTIITLGASGTSTCSLSSSTAGSYTVTVTGTSETLSHSATISATVTQVTTAHATRTNVTCFPGSVTVNVPTTCMARVKDTTSNPTTPTGTVAFTTNSTGGFSPSATCALTAGSGPAMASCSVSYTPTVAGLHMIAGSYSGDSGHAPSSGSFTVNVRSSRGGPVLLTFNGFDLDDFDNGVSQLQVFVNGQFVVDIPAGLNHLTGTGDFDAYGGTDVNFGPFDITSFLVNGQNTILFQDPTSFDHYGIVSNVTIVQGNTLLLHSSRGRGVFPGFSPRFTFSNPALTITSFTSVTSSNQGVTTTAPDVDLIFTATYAGGTGPFTCIFSFGDGDHAVVAGSNGACSTTHDYDDPGTFSAVVLVKGASTSDLVSARMTVTVTGD